MQDNLQLVLLWGYFSSEYDVNDKLWFIILGQEAYWFPKIRQTIWLNMAIKSKTKKKKKKTNLTVFPEVVKPNSCYRMPA